MPGPALPDLKQFEGKTLDEVAKMWNKAPIDALMDFVLADPGRTDTIYFLASEEDLKFGLQQPWTSIGLDYGEMSLDGPMHEAHGHPRAFGSVPRFLGRYVRDEHLLSLEVRHSQAHLASSGARTSRRIEVCSAPAILRTSWFLMPIQSSIAPLMPVPDRVSEGVDVTIVNGQVEYDHGKLSGANAGRVLRGRGWQLSSQTTAPQ